MGGSIFLKSAMTIASIQIITNFFYNGRGAWGAYFDFELSTHAYLKKNVFEKGNALMIGSAYEDHIGTGSIVIMSGLSEKVHSIYHGISNLYIDCWSENKGKIKFQYFLKIYFFRRFWTVWSRNNRRKFAFYKFINFKLI